METKIYKLVEYCEDCPNCHPWNVNEHDQVEHVCLKTENKLIPMNDYIEGILPNWCPLEKE